MKWLYFCISLILFPIFSLKLTAQDQINIFSDFDRASVGSLKQISDSCFRGQTMHWIKKDRIGNQYYWFYFRIEPVKGKKLTFEFDNMIGTYRSKPHEIYSAYTQPVMSYNNKDWQRITDISYDKKKKSFRFTVSFQQDTAWIAYAHPYSFARGEHLLDSIRPNKYVKPAGEGISSGGRPVRMIEITDYSISTENKKRILITSLQHAGEDCGGYFMEGVIRKLLSNDPEAEDIRRNFIFYLIPVMNPGGLFQGCSRYNTDMEDLNSEWDDDITDTVNLPVEPEVKFVKSWVRSFYDDGNKFDLFIDVHSHGQKGKSNGLCIESDSLSALTRITNKYWKLDNVKQNDFTGSAGWFFNHHWHVPSGTLELTQSTCGEDNYLDTKDYRFYGSAFIKAVNEYFGFDRK